MEHGQYERGAVLAEKYCDFGILVELCEAGSGRRDRLRHYMDQFSSKVSKQTEQNREIYIDHIESCFKSCLCVELWFHSKGLNVM